MKRLISILLITMLFLCGCSVVHEDSAAPGERVENETAGQLQGEQNQSNDKKEDGTSSQKEQTPSDEKEQTSSGGQKPSEEKEQTSSGGQKPSEEKKPTTAKTLGELHDTGWSPGSAFIYKGEAFYHLEREDEAYIYSLKLGKGNKPVFLSVGKAWGQYGDLLFKEEGDQLMALDLSDRKGGWKKLGKVLEDSLVVEAEDRLLVFGEDQDRNILQSIDLKKRTLAQKALAFEVESAAYGDETVYFSTKEKDQTVLYKADAALKSPEIIHRAKEDFKWILHERRILFYKDGYSPYILNPDTLETFKFRSFEEEGIVDGAAFSRPRMIRFWEGVAYIEMTNGNYYAYDIAKDQGKELEEIPDAKRQKLRNGGSFTGGGTSQEHTFRVSLGGREYVAYQNGYTGLYLQDADATGAILTHASRIFTCRWEDGQEFENFRITEHPFS